MSGYNLDLLVKKRRQETREDEEEREIQKYQSQSLTSLHFFFFLVCMKLLQLCPSLWNPMDCSLPGSFVHGILQARIWSGLPFPHQGIFPTLGLNVLLKSPALAGGFFTTNTPFFLEWSKIPCVNFFKVEIVSSTSPNARRLKKLI